MPINSPKLPPPAVGLAFDGKGKATLIAATVTQTPPEGAGGACSQQK